MPLASLTCVQNPETLHEIARKQNARKGLKIVSDKTFNFLKLLDLKVKCMQTYKELQRNPINIQQYTILKLMQDIPLVEIWCNLFSSNSSQHGSPTQESEETISQSSDSEDEESEYSYECEEDELLDYELEQSLILQLLEKVITYICSVHLSDLLGTYKDNKLEVKKGLSIRHSLGSAMKKSEIFHKEVPFPCGKCQKECVDIEAMRNPKKEDISVLCDKCEKWYHYICVGLSGKEVELQEGSNLEYYCPDCKSPENVSTAENTCTSEILPNTSLPITSSISQEKCTGGAKPKGNLNVHSLLQHNQL